MPRTTQAGLALASVRDMLSKHQHPPRALTRLHTGAPSVQTLETNPAQPPQLRRDPLQPPFSTLRLRYQDGSTALLQQKLHDPANPQPPSRARAWLEPVSSPPLPEHPPTQVVPYPNIPILLFPDARPHP